MVTTYDHYCSIIIYYCIIPYHCHLSINCYCYSIAVTIIVIIVLWVEHNHSHWYPFSVIIIHGCRNTYFIIVVMYGL